MNMSEKVVINESKEELLEHLDLSFLDMGLIIYIQHKLLLRKQ